MAANNTQVRGDFIRWADEQGLNPCEIGGRDKSVRISHDGLTYRVKVKGSDQDDKKRFLPELYGDTPRYHFIAEERIENREWADLVALVHKRDVMLVPIDLINVHAKWEHQLWAARNVGSGGSVSRRHIRMNDDRSDQNSFLVDDFAGLSWLQRSALSQEHLRLSYLQRWTIPETTQTIRTIQTLTNLFEKTKTPRPLPATPSLDDLERDEREYISRVQVYRPDQIKFRKEQLNRYRRCVITGCTIFRLLEAAHLLGYTGAASNHSDFGLLLRVDIHRAWDDLKISCDVDTMTVWVSPEYRNEYPDLHGRPFLFDAMTGHPSLDALREHRLRTMVEAGI